MQNVGIVVAGLVLATVIGLAPAAGADPDPCVSAQVVDVGGAAYVGVRGDGSVWVAAESNGQPGLQADEYVLDTSSTPCH